LRAGGEKKYPFVRPATFDDYDQIAAVEAANGLSIKSHEEWLHLWQNNPAYQQIPDWPIGWVLEDEDGCVVGSLGNVPCLYRFHGRTYVGAFGRGWAVDARYRAYSLLLLIAQLQQPNVDFRLTTTASRRTEAVLTQRGWRRTPAGRWDLTALWVASYVQIVRHYLATKALCRLSALAGPLLRLSVPLKDIAPDQRVKLKSGLELRWSMGFDERFEEFWTELESRNSSVLLSTRCRQTLQWHYKYALEQKRIWILTACDGPRLVAYAVFERKEARAVLIDFQALVKDAGLVSAMISCALKRCRQERVALLENVGCWLEAVQPLSKLPRFRRGLVGWCYLYQASNPELAASLRSADSWYPTQYDADASL
jgi:hypothetical protein